MNLEKKPVEPELAIGDAYTFIRNGLLHPTGPLQVGEIVSREFAPGGRRFLFRVVAVYGPGTIETVFIGFEPDEPQDAAADPRGRGPDSADAMAYGIAATAA